MISVRHADNGYNEQDTISKSCSWRWAGSMKHLNRMAKNEREKPNRTMEMAVPATDIKRTGLRPM